MRDPRKMNKQDIYKSIVNYLKKEGSEKVAIFGSYVKDEEKPDSDIDVLVTFSFTKSLFELARMERELSEKIGIKVDLLTMNSISPYIRDTVKKEMKVVYG
jgi:predicted nucleotidyltransferase